MTTTGRGVCVVAGVECRKLIAQPQTWIILILCASAPFGFVAAMRTQSAVPSDTLFGRLVHESGLATPLVVLGFAGLWGLPIVASIAGGDMFASEDRHGTWPAMLTRSRSRSETFAAKILVACIFATLALALLATSAVGAGSLLVGLQPLVDLSGVLLPPRAALIRIMLAWLSVVPPCLAITSAAMLTSVATRSSVAGVGVPVVATFALQLIAFADAPALFRLILPTTAFEGWHGLLAQPAFYGPIVLGTGVNVVCAAVSISIARRIFLRRNIV